MISTAEVEAIRSGMARLQETLKAMQDYSSANVKRNADLDSMARETGCPICKGAVAAEVTDALPQMAGLQVVSPKTLVCRACSVALYPPPHYSLLRKAREFFESAKILQPVGPRHVTAHLLHQAAELYLKALGSYEVHPLQHSVDAEPESDDEGERVEGEVLKRRKHELNDLRGVLPVYVKRRLKADKSREECVERAAALPRDLSIAFRYGVSDRRLPATITTDSTLLLDDGRDVIAILRDLCTSLDRFSGQVRRALQ